MTENLVLKDLIVSQNVLTQLVVNAAAKVKGVAYVNGQNVATALTSFLIQRTGKPEEHVEAYVEPSGKMVVEVPVAVFFGYPFPELAEDIRKRVAKTLQEQLGVTDPVINVRINELLFPKE